MNVHRDTKDITTSMVNHRDCRFIITSMNGDSKTVSYQDIVKENFEDLEKEDFERQREVFLLNFFKRRGLSFEKENLDKPVTLRTVLEIIMEVSNK